MRRIKMTNGTYALLMTILFFVSPFLTFVISLCLFRNVISQIFFVAFAFYFGWQVGPNMDLLNHYHNYLTFLGKSLWQMFVDPYTLYIGKEPFHFLFKYILSIFRASERVFAGCACAVYAACFILYMRQIRQYFQHLNLIKLIILIGAAVAIEFHWFFGLRFWTGAFVFMIFYVKYMVTKNKLYLLLTPVCLLFHVVLVIFVGCAFLAEIIRSVKLQYILLAVSFFYKYVDFGFAKFVASLPFVKMFYKTNYQSQDLQTFLAQKTKDYLENGNIVYRLRLPIMIFGIFFTLFLLWIKNKNVNKVFPQMYGMFLITFAVANFGYSDMIFYGRVLKMATLVGYAYLFMVISQKENVNTIKSLFVKSIMGGIVLFGLATALVEERMFLLNIPLWFGNFFTEVPLLEYDD